MYDTALATRVAELRKAIARNTGQIASSMDAIRYGVNHALTPPAHPLIKAFSEDDGLLMAQYASKLEQFLETEDGKDACNVLMLAFRQFLVPESLDDVIGKDETGSETSSQNPEPAD